MRTISIGIVSHAYPFSPSISDPVMCHLQPRHLARSDCNPFTSSSPVTPPLPLFPCHPLRLDLDHLRYPFDDNDASRRPDRSTGSSNERGAVTGVERHTLHHYLREGDQTPTRRSFLISYGDRVVVVLSFGGMAITFRTEPSSPTSTLPFDII